MGVRFPRVRTSRGELGSLTLISLQSRVSRARPSYNHNFITFSEAFFFFKMERTNSSAAFTNCAFVIFLPLP